jgi:acetolactate synthase-1/2/3 large subunit
LKLSDFVIDFISQHTKRVFVLVGGGSMHLNDSLGKSKLEYTCMLHEQGASLAAQAYGHITNQLGVCMVTTGPGGTNAVTGCLAAWMDATPVLFISGQVQTSQMIGTSGRRYVGTQECDIVSIVAPITKYATSVMDPAKIKIYLGAAVYAATHGRKGPTWIDIPLDVQSADINPNELEPFSVPYNEWTDWQNQENIRIGVDAVKEATRNVSKPVIFAGYGIISSNAEKRFFSLIDAFRCPILTTWKSIGLLSDNHPLYCGRPGAFGQRAANKIQQACDFILVLGAKLDFDQTAYQLDTFAPLAKKIIVDIDPSELSKYNDSWIKINCDVKEFLERLNIGGDYSQWTKECKEMQKENVFI